MRSSNQRKLMALEAHYRDILIMALERCATGTWGLFGHNDDALRNNPALAERLRPPELDELLALGDEIAALRERLGYADPFDLHARLVELRRPPDANALGESRRARLWLDELTGAPSNAPGPR